MGQPPSPSGVRGESVPADPEGAIAAALPGQPKAHLLLGPRYLAKVFLGLDGFYPGGSECPVVGRLVFAEVVEAAEDVEKALSVCIT